MLRLLNFVVVLTVLGSVGCRCNGFGHRQAWTCGSDCGAMSGRMDCQQKQCICGENCGGGCMEWTHYSLSQRIKHLFCGAGCTDRYWGDWISHRPEKCDPCDNCGNWTGRCCQPRRMFGTGCCNQSCCGCNSHGQGMMAPTMGHPGQVVEEWSVPQAHPAMEGPAMEGRRITPSRETRTAEVPARPASATKSSARPLSTPGVKPAAKTTTSSTKPASERAAGERTSIPKGTNGKSANDQASTTKSSKSVATKSTGASEAKLVVKASAERPLPRRSSTAHAGPSATSPMKSVLVKKPRELETEEEVDE